MAAKLRQMTAGSVRRSLHGVHALTSIVLVLTGLLILYPDLRTRTIGGYGRETGRLHLYVGLVFTVVPLAAWALAKRELLSGAWQRIPAAGATAAWRRLHVLITLLASTALAGTGLVLWLADDLPIAVWDFVAGVHVYAHWAVIASLPVHLLASRRRIVERIRLALGAEPQELFDFVDDADEGPGGSA